MKLHFKSRAELQHAMASGAFAGLALHMMVLHDDACTPDFCVCEPEFVVDGLTQEVFEAGQKAQADWVAEKVRARN